MFIISLNSYFKDESIMKILLLIQVYMHAAMVRLQESAQSFVQRVERGSRRV